MTAFGVQTSNVQSVRDFVEATNTRLSNPNMLNNPFYGKLELKEDTLFVYMRPVYPNVSWIGIIAFFVGYMIGGFKINYWCMITLPFLIAGIFYTKYFYYLILRKALRKCEFVELKRIKLLSTTETIRRIVHGPE